MGGSSSKQTSLEDAPLVVIIGAGYGGRQLAVQLEDKYNVLVLEPRDAMYHSVGAMRACVDEEFAPKILVPYTNALKRGKIVKARATRVTKDAVFIEGSDAPIPFDYLVIATGAGYELPGMRVAADDRAHMLDEPAAMRAKIEKADNILIVGAGPVGVEFSGEILKKFPEKTVTLVTNKPHILPSKHFKESLGIELEQRLESKKGALKFKIIADTRVNPGEQKEGAGYVTTDKGDKLEAEEVFYCIGSQSRASNAALFADINHSVDAATGKLKVDDYLRVEGHSNIFAIGDVALIDQPATAVTAQATADYLAATIPALDAKKTPANYAVGSEMLFVPFGTLTGVAVLNGNYLTGCFGFLGEFMATKLKGGDLLTGKYWGEFNADLEKPEYKTTDFSSEEVQAVIKRWHAKNDK